jgi:NitT/TauT family transport system permease protein
MELTCMSWRSPKLRQILIGSLGFFLILGIWHAVTTAGLVKDFFLPAPKEVFTMIYRMLTVQGFLGDVGISSLRIALGFTLASALAIPLGMAIGLNKTAQDAAEPLIDFIRYTPVPAFIPLFILWFGIGELEKIMVIAVSVFFQLVLMVANSVSQTPREIIDSAKTLGAGRWQVIRLVIFQLGKPRIYDDMRVSIGWAWAVLMMAELVGSTSGIGYVIIQSQRLLKTSTVIAAILITGTIGLGIDIILKWLYAKLFPWARKIEHET